MSHRSRLHFALLALIPLLVLAIAVALNPAAPSPAKTSARPAGPAETQAIAAPITQVEGAPSSARTGSTAKKVVVLDPGHGGDEVGAAANGVVEKASNLDMALRVEKLLLADGYDVVLTRRTDTRVSTGDLAGYTATRADLQARIDAANAAHGDVFVSLHSNGSSDPSQNGVEAWYDSKRDYATENKALAQSILDNVLGELHNFGYDATNRGLLDGSCFRQLQGRCFTLFVIGGPRLTTREDVTRRGGDPEALGFNGAESIYSRATQMPSVLIENLIITNRSDAAILASDGGRDAIARGVANGIEAFLTNPQ